MRGYDELYERKPSCKRSMSDADNTRRQTRAGVWIEVVVVVEVDRRRRDSFTALMLTTQRYHSTSVVLHAPPGARSPFSINLKLSALPH